MIRNFEIPLQSNKTYHIFNHANGWENLFLNADNFMYFLKRYEYFIQPIATTFAYCLMPNHLHLMVKIKNEEALKTAFAQFQLDKGIQNIDLKPFDNENAAAFTSKTFGNLFSSYAQAFNKQQNRRGALFMPNFKRKEIVDDNYFKKLVFYIHNNPVHHGFVIKMEDWVYSSYNTYLHNKHTKIDKSTVLNLFGSDIHFNSFHCTSRIDDSFEF